MSAASVSRTGLPFSQLSATASISLSFSIASAIALSTSARWVVDASPQASFAACAASSASSTSSGVESATSVIGPAVAGARSTRYLPCVGASHLPPMKFSYLGSTETMLPGWPGAAYFMSGSFRDWSFTEGRTSGRYLLDRRQKYLPSTEHPHWAYVNGGGQADVRLASGPAKAFVGNTGSAGTHRSCPASVHRS